MKYPGKRPASLAPPPAFYATSRRMQEGARRDNVQGGLPRKSNYIPSGPGIGYFFFNFAAMRSCCRIAAFLAIFTLLGFCSGCGGFTSTTPSVQAPSTSSQSRFSLIGKLSGIGYAANSMVGPAPHGTQRYYISYIYDSTVGLDIVGVDPTGKVSVFPTPVPGQVAAWGELVGTDGNMYFGTAPNAHLMRLNTSTDQIEDLGIPAKSEQYLWELTNGADGKIYGCTYPSAQLIRYDPKTSKMEDLGRMDPSEQYARTIAADRNGFVYVGIGSLTSNIAAYEIATGQHREIIPPAYLTPGFGQLVVDSGGQVHARVGMQWFSLNGWVATPENTAPVQPPSNIFADGTAISIANGTVQLNNPNTDKITSLPYAYSGKELSAFRMVLGPDNTLYASTALPLYLFRQGTNGFSNLGQLGAGEAYSFLPLNGNLLIGTYSGLAPLMSYDVSRGITLSGPEPNPTMVAYNGEREGWRPFNMIAAGDGNVYISSMADYGQPASPLTRWNPQTNSVENLSVLNNQSTTSVAWANNELIVGTSISGGLGTEPTAKQAELVVLNSNGTPVFTTVPVQGAASIANLVSLPSGLVAGIADKTAFLFDPVQRQVVATNATALSSAPLDDSLALDADGNIWGLTSGSIFRLDPSTLSVTESAQPPEPITSGMAIDAQNIYFGSNSDVYSFRWKDN